MDKVIKSCMKHGRAATFPLYSMGICLFLVLILRRVRSSLEIYTMGSPLLEHICSKDRM